MAEVASRYEYLSPRGVRASVAIAYNVQLNGGSLYEVNGTRKWLSSWLQGVKR